MIRRPTSAPRDPSSEAFHGTLLRKGQPQHAAHGPGLSPSPSIVFHRVRSALPAHRSSREEADLSANLFPSPSLAQWLREMSAEGRWSRKGAVVELIATSVVHRAISTYMRSSGFKPRSRRPLCKTIRAASNIAMIATFFSGLLAYMTLKALALLASSAS